MTNSNQQTLSRLFNNNEGPTITGFNQSDLKNLISLHVPEQLSWFEGHFPEQKVLPGVVQLDWAGKFAKALYPNLGAFRQVSNIKFKTVVFPSMDLNLELEHNPDKGNVKFHFHSQTASFSTGIFKFLMS